MQNIEDLAILLTKAIKENKHNRTVVESVKNSMLEKYGVLRGQTQLIFREENKIEHLDKNNLIRFTIEFYRHTNIYNLNPHLYFTNKELDAAKKEDALKDAIEKFPIKITNAVQVDENTYIAFVDAGQLVRLYNSNLLEYNYKINQQYKFVRNREGKLVQTMDIDSQRVKELSEMIGNAKYSIDKVILNVMVGSSFDGKEITYNKENRELLIHQAQVDIIDGLHDISALMLALNNNPQLSLKVELEIKHLDMHGIKTYFNKLNVKGGVN